MQQYELVRKTITTIALATLLGNIVTAQPGAPNVEKKIDSLIQAYYQPGGPGVAVSVVRDGKIIYNKQVGHANLEYGIPITDSTVFHIASVSKQFTALAALLLEKEGKLSLEDDIKKYLPELKDLPYKITIRQLANHTHGFANTYELARLIGISPSDVMSQQQMIKILLHQRHLNFVPGTQYQYNNSGFALLAEIVQRVSGKPFAEFMKERIFTPLKMDHTLFLDDLTTVIKNKAHSYKRTTKGFSAVPFNFTVVGASGLNTTPHDLSLWAMNFDSPVVGDQKLLAEMQKPSHLNSGQLLPYALGQEIKIYKGLQVIFHGGGDAGYRAYLARVPAYRFSVIVLGNFESFNPLDLSYAIIDKYLEKYEQQQAPPKVPSYTNAQLKKWQGDYEIFPGSFFSIVAKADSLYLKSFGSQAVYVLPVIGENEFLFPYAPHSKLVFSNGGLLWHFSDFSYRCEKVSLDIPAKSSVNLKEFTGIYMSDELETSYRLVVKNNELVAVHAINPDILLHPLAKDAFYSDKSFFGKQVFIRSKTNHVTGFKLSGQNLKDVYFRRFSDKGLKQ
jgi:CubicO group peptidase (beta-lactamase class C family)